MKPNQPPPPVKKYGLAPISTFKKRDSDLTTEKSHEFYNNTVVSFYHDINIRKEGALKQIIKRLLGEELNEEIARRITCFTTENKHYDAVYFLDAGKNTEQLLMEFYVINLQGFPEIKIISPVEISEIY